MQRRLYKVEKWGVVKWRRRWWWPFAQAYDPDADQRVQVEFLADANCISSLLEDGRGIHMPAIDIDHDCRLVRTSTPGHFHLYVNVPVGWFRYRLLLWAMVQAGIVERGYYGAVLAHVRHDPLVTVAGEGLAIYGGRGLGAADRLRLVPPPQVGDLLDDELRAGRHERLGLVEVEGEVHVGGCSGSPSFKLR